LEGVCDACGIPSANHYYNVVDYGNSGAAGAPTVLSMNWEKFKEGDKLVIAVVGSGLSWSSAYMSFGGDHDI
jgi:3-oxoacyl-[acyl-carrier-protein] synthase-3